MADFTLSEEWRPVEGWPYEVSNLGRVRRATDGRRGRSRVVIPKGQVLQASPGRGGYLRVSLCGGDRRTKRMGYIAKLVCTAFHGPQPSADHEVAHWDGNKKNNQSGNLRWATTIDNHADKIRHGTILRGNRNPSAILTENDVRRIKRLLSSGERQVRIAEQYGVTKHCINDISTGRAWGWLQTGP